MDDTTSDAAPAEEAVEDASPRTIDVDDALVEVRDAALREIDVRLVPWDQTIETVLGPEEFARGAFRDTPDDGLYLMEPEHGGVQLGIGQDGSAVPKRVPVGRSTRVRDEADGLHATFRVARTAKGDESLALATDRILSGVSVEFAQVPGGTVYVNRNGRRVRRHQTVTGRGAVLTHRPAYGEQAVVLAVRSQHSEVAPVTEATTTAPEAAPVIVQTSASALTPEMFRSGMEEMAAQFSRPVTELIGRLSVLEEQSRASFDIPGKHGATPKTSPGQWMKTVLRLMSGDTVPDVETRALADLITSDNAGVVPDNYLSEMIGIIDPARPFLDSVRKIDPGDSGMTLQLPKIVTRPTVGTQAEEKDEVTSTATSITNVGWDAITKAGAGDISLQLLKRSSPSFLSLYLELLAEAYAIETDDEAIDVLLAASGLHSGGALDPEDASFGAAWGFGAAVSRRLTPTHIWLSSDAVGAFIDAKASGTNAPLYSNLEANFTAGGGPGGSISGLRPVHVPALDDEAVDIIVGPSRGFLWAEDGTYTLQVDVPAKAGRDVALVGILWLMPIYPTAFTKYTLGGS